MPCFRCTLSYLSGNTIGIKVLRERERERREARGSDREAFGEEGQVVEAGNRSEEARKGM